MVFDDKEYCEFLFSYKGLKMKTILSLQCATKYNKIS